MSQTVHLVVLVHGMWGNPDHLAEMDRIIREQRASEPGPSGEQLVTLAAKSNAEGSTYDGIDWGGERVAEEVLEEVKRLAAEDKKVTKLSVVGYSLGGLVSRYLVGILQQRGFFENVKPMNFITVATPHIGLVRFPSFRSRMFAYLGPRLLSRTGEQFYAVDKWSASGRPLLEVMADPERIFYQALSSFERICFYANAINDVTVPYLTAAVETEDIFDDYDRTGLEIEFDDKYAPIIKSYRLPDTPPPPPEKPKRFSKKWFKGLQPRVPLPPILRANFPYNMIVYALLPVLIPTFMTLAVVRLSLDSRKSRGRIRLLESDESYRERLVNLVGAMEKQIEDAVVEYMDEPVAVAHCDEPSVSGGDSAATLAPAAPGGAVAKAQKKGAELTPRQRRMAKHLNALPHFEKKLAFIDLVLNSHAIIVARDVKRFAFHARGHGVLTHLADHMVL
ncbi:putative lipase [Phanerochaete sordida]|uniref:Lipase n=1 Tax=Phanerochaete sordida TaxID=48140 RepID=A0A9P3LDV1_9APHY|nr:putative lipase [Phanerochaete sordida]